MFEYSADPVKASPLASRERAIDLVHLSRVTLGDRSLEREVLQLFDRQAALILSRLREAGPRGIVPLAHTLKGSARSVGASRIARAAEAVEAAAACPPAMIAELETAINEARAMIAELLRAP